MSHWIETFLTKRLVAEISLAGMALDVLGGCYLAYDLLGAERGPLRTISRAAGYVALFFVGYAAVLGFQYAVIAATGMGILLAIESLRATPNQSPPGVKRSGVLLFGFLRGLVLGLAGIAVGGLMFGVAFGLLSGLGLAISYAAGFAPTDDYETNRKPRITRHKMVASLFRAVMVSIAGIAAAMLSPSESRTWVFGLRLGLAAGVVSALVGFFSPAIEWWIEHLPERRLGIWGLVLILIGMVLQSTQYWLVVFTEAAK